MLNYSWLWGVCCRTLWLGSDAHLEPPVGTELSHLVHNILGEEGVVEDVLGCESLLRVHHQHPRDLRRANTESLIHPLVANLYIDSSRLRRWPTKSFTVSERSSHSGDERS